MESEKRSFLLVALMIVALACAPAQPSQARPASERTASYILPLIGNYAIARRDLETSRNDSDLFTLVELTPNPSGIPHGWANFVDSVKSVGVQKPLIIGEVNDGFFIFDTSAKNPQPASYKTLEALRADLLKKGLSDKVSLVDPKVMAASLSNRVLRPWEYQIMRGVLGQSDADLGGLLIICGWLASFVVGFRQKRRRSLLAAGALIGLVTNIVGRIILCGEGPAGGVGLVLEPLICWGLAAFGRVIGTAFWPGATGRSTSRPVS